MVYLGLTVPLVVVAFAFGEMGQGTVYLAVGSAAVVAGPIGVRIHRPNTAKPWLLFSLGAALFVGSAIVRIIHGNLAGTTDPFPSPADVLGLGAYVASFLGAHALLHSRSKTVTRSLNLDAGMIALGLGTFVWVYVMGPHVTDMSATVAERAFNTAYSIGDLLLAFMIVRVALAPGKRPLAYYLLAAGAGATLIADTLVILDLAGTFSFPGRIAFAALPLALLGAAALDPTMSQLTMAVEAPKETLTTRRLTMMAVAILLPPIVLLFQNVRGQGALVPVIVSAWAGVSLLGMARLAELIRSKQRDVERQAILLAADERLVAATDRDDIVTAALDALHDLLDEPTQCQYGLALMDDGELEVKAARGFKVAAVQGLRIDIEELEALGVCLETSRPSVVRSPLELPGARVGWLVVAPLLSHQDLIGAILVTSVERPPGVLVEAAPSLATGVTLALEAAQLTEQMHRQRSERQFRSLVEKGSDVVAVLDENNAFTFVSASAERLLEISVDDLSGTSILDLAIDEDRPMLESLMSSARLGGTTGRSVGPAEIRLRDLYDQVHTVEMVLTDLTDDEGVNGMVVNAHDVTDRKNLEESLRYQALHDSLTGLANRFMFQQRVSHALLRRSTIEDVVGVLFLDLDDFKTVNDSLGHATGDNLLKLVAERLKACLHSGDTSARLGGDEFAILLEDTAHKSDVIAAAERIIESLSKPFVMDSRLIEIGVSIGVAFADNDSSDVDVLLRNADVAMYASKQGGKNCFRLFEQEMHASVFERLELKAELAKAIRNDDLTLAYQPIVALKERRVEGFEALMRWTHPTRGSISPLTFIPIAEESGLIIPMGEWLLREALSRLKQWQGEHENTAELWMSVNVSVEQLADPGFIDAVDRSLIASGVNPNCLTLEVTESVLADDIEKIAARLNRVKSLGVKLAIDDFGTGYSSLGYLQKLPFDKLKIDKTFIDLLEEGTEDARLVLSILEMSQRLGLPVIAEGIESAHQAKRLVSLDCDYGQGYHFARPMAPENVVTLLKGSAEAGLRIDAKPAAVMS